MKLRRTIISFVVALLFMAPASRIRSAPWQSVPFVMAAVVAPLKTATNNATRTTKSSAREIKTPVEPGQKRQARFLAALGMVIISLLALAAAVALLRSLRQH